MAEYPLRQLVCDPSERFQLRFAEQGALLLHGFAGVNTERTARGLVLRAVAERDLTAAALMLRIAFPSANAGAVEVVLRDEGRAEPYVEVHVVVPEDCYGEVLGQLNQRRGLIEFMADTGDRRKRVTATAPLAQMLGYDEVLSATSRNRASIDYKFAGYRPVQ